MDRGPEEINPSQIKAYERCVRVWAWAYLYGCKSSGPGTVLGSEVHGLLDPYLRNGTEIPYPGEPLYLTAHGGGLSVRYPGAIAHKGLAFLPPPKIAEVETGWKREFDGIHFRGTMDALVPPGLWLDGPGRGGEWLDTTPPRWESYDLPVVIDHKTTSARKYALTEATLPHDLQWIIYGWNTAERFGVDAVAGRWVYYPTRDENTGWAVDTMLPASELRLQMRRRIVPVARQILSTARRMGLPIVDVKTVAGPRLEVLFPEDRTRILRELPVDISDGRCSQYGGCPHKGLCTDVHPNGLGGVHAFSIERFVQTMTDQSQISMEMRTAAALQRMDREGWKLAEGWKRMDAPHGEFVYNTALFPDKSLHIVEYLDNHHQATVPPAINPPPAPPQPPAVPQVPAVPQAPPTPPQIPPQPPAVPQVPGAVPAALDEAGQLWAELVRRGLAKPGPGRKPGVESMRTILSEGITVDAWRARNKAGNAPSPEATPPAAQMAPVAPPAGAEVVPEGFVPFGPEHPHWYHNPVTGQRINTVLGVSVEKDGTPTPAPTPAPIPAAPKQPKAPKANPLPENPATGNASGAREYTLCINCVPIAGTGRPVVHFRDVFREVSSTLAAQSITLDNGTVVTGVRDYRTVPYGRGKALYTEALRAVLADLLGKQGANGDLILCVDATHDEGRDALAVLESLCTGLVLRGV